MSRKEFAKLYREIEEREKTEKKTGFKWLLGYVEGLGKRKLTGFQIGALLYLLVSSDKDLSVNEETETEIETDSSFSSL